MNKEEMTHSVKEAILFELRGQALYESAANHSNSQAVKDLFTTLADEEKSHAMFLKKFFHDPQQVQKEEKSALPANGILSADIIHDIEAAGFEAAVISAAIELEIKSSAFYMDKAKTALDSDVKKFFNWLADWEKGHLRLLNELDQALKEKIWHDHQFWPLD